MKVNDLSIAVALGGALVVDSAGSWVLNRHEDGDELLTKVENRERI